MSASPSSIGRNKLVPASPGGEIQEVEDTIDEKFRDFNHFEIVSKPPRDHYFLKYNIISPMINCRPLICQKKSEDCGGGSRRRLRRSSSWEERMRNEWQALTDGLPNSIFVRVYESRRDLLRAVIIGLEDTPYSYGLFFFDMYFPKNYPTSPPLLYYRHHDSCGGIGNLNPSLSALTATNNNSTFKFRSCLGTTSTLKSHFFKWDPSESNILRLLAVVQGEILNAKNDNTDHQMFVLSHKAMLYNLKSPPNDFEDFVKGYFRKYSHAIVMQFKATLCKKAANDAYDDFTVMQKLDFGLLIKAFEANGSYCNHLFCDW